jgi:hypothetical protein
MDNLLNQILSALNLPEDKIVEFKERFSGVLVTEILLILHKTKPDLFKNFDEAIKNMGKSPDNLKTVFNEIYSYPEIKARIDTSVDKLIEELAETIKEYATEEEKIKVLNTVARQTTPTPNI